MINRSQLGKAKQELSSVALSDHNSTDIFRMQSPFAVGRIWFDAFKRKDVTVRRLSPAKSPIFRRIPYTENVGLFPSEVFASGDVARECKVLAEVFEPQLSGPGLVLLIADDLVDPSKGSLEVDVHRVSLLIDGEKAFGGGRVAEALRRFGDAVAVGAELRDRGLRERSG